MIMSLKERLRKNSPVLFRLAKSINQIRLSGIHQWRRIARQPIRLIQQRRNSRLARTLRQAIVEIEKSSVRPFFVKVGANDGITGDPCGDMLIANAAWHGLLVEPEPNCIQQLQKTYNDSGRFHIAQVAIDSDDGNRVFYSVCPSAIESIPNLPEWFNQLGSFDRKHIISHLDGVLEPFIQETTVQTRRLSTLINEMDLRYIDFLHIDTEGHDLRVFETLNLDMLSPRLILIERKHLSKNDDCTLQNLLRAHNYRIMSVADDVLASAPSESTHTNGR